MARVCFPMTIVKAAVATLGVLLSGCFSYKAAEPASLPQGGQVRVHLTRQGFAALPETTDLSRPRISGTLVSRDNDHVRVRVPLAFAAPGADAARDYVVPARDILVVEVRELSRMRTGLAVASGIAAAAAFYIAFEKGNPFSNDNAKPPEEEGSFRFGRRSQLVVNLPR